jgi:hypothetical protein
MCMPHLARPFPDPVSHGARTDEGANSVRGIKPEF